MNKFYVLVGSNIEPQENVKKGLNLIKESNEIKLEAVSSEHISKAVGMDGDNFLNLVLRCTTELDFKDTVSLLKNIEVLCGRTRDPNNKFTSRTLDLDIIIWNDFEGFIDGKPFENGSSTDFPLVLGSNSFIPGFEDQLIGLKKNEEKVVKVTFPENYGNKELSGKDFKIFILFSLAAASKPSPETSTFIFCDSKLIFSSLQKSLQ